MERLQQALAQVDQQLHVMLEQNQRMRGQLLKRPRRFKRVSMTAESSALNPIPEDDVDRTPACPRRVQDMLPLPRTHSSPSRSDGSSPSVASLVSFYEGLSSTHSQQTPRHSVLSYDGTKGELTFTLRSSANLTLVAVSFDSQKTVFNVSAEVVASMSRAWDAMLTGPWKEGSSSEIELLDDDAGAVHIVLLIAHLQTKQLPKQVDFETLVNLAIFCDKWDTVHFVRPHTRDWLKQWKPHATDAGYEGLVFVAYTFGDLETFKTVACHLVRTVTVSSCGQYPVTKEGKVLGKLPPGVTDHILAARRRCIRAALAALKQSVDLAFAGGSCRARFPGCALEKVDCNTWMLGAYLQALQGKGFFNPLPTEAERVEMSLGDLADTLGSIRLRQLVPHSQTVAHRCDPGAGLAALMEMVVAEEAVEKALDGVLKEF
ncbi:hypothetical protein LTS18_003750 [Coniosporium uncinatum]|uniref:Uncharacterized protein n=1 Tax=Coniosporium uncinatum TaxID=93489 RepID=A0ACC3DTH4_9PEZI|nr:hypothetical protein LTS18_003750 [Coniosporium uncinatum]